MNDLERNEDADGQWRCYGNHCLDRGYSKLFEPIDMLVYIRPPDFECVFKWRQLQETKLAEASKAERTHIMGETELRRFIMHYERLTRHMMEVMPGRADVVIDINENQRVENVTAR